MSGRFNFTNANNRNAGEAGSRFLKQLTHTDSTGAAIPITGWTFQMQVRTTTGILIVEASTSNGDIVITDGPNGVFRIDISSSVMEGLAPGDYQYDLEYTDAGEVYRLMEGDFEITSQETV